MQGLGVVRSRLPLRHQVVRRRGDRGLQESPYGFRYDIFEKLPDGKVIWRFSVTGRDNAIAQFEQIAAISANEVFVMQVDTQEVVVRKLP